MLSYNHSFILIIHPDFVNKAHLSTYEDVQDSIQRTNDDVSTPR